LLYLSFYIFINAKGKDIIVESVEKKLGVKVSLDSFSFKFPFNAEIVNFKCADISFKDAKISQISFNPFIFRLTLNRIDVDSFRAKITKVGDKIYFDPFLEQKPQAKNKTAAQIKTASFISSFASISSNANGKTLSFSIKNLRLKNSRVELALEDDESKAIALDDITFNLKSFNYPKLSKFYINLNASVLLVSKNIKIEDVLTLGGWVDYSNKNMDVNVNINNFDYLSFEDYYPRFYRPGSFALKEAILSLKSKLDSKDNDLTIDCYLSVEKIEFIANLREDSEEFSKANTLKTALALLKGNKDKPTLHFSLKTKMDSPKLDFVSVKDSIKLKINPIDMIGGVINKAKDDLTGGIKKAGERTVDTIKDTVKDVKETLKDTVKDALDAIKGIFKP